MIRSMTGYGKGTAKSGTMMVEMEIQSINSRFLEVFIRSSKELLCYDDKIKDMISKELKRGKVNVYANVVQSQSAAQALSFDEQAIQHYVGELRRIRERFQLSGDVTIQDLLENKDMFGMRPKSIDAQKAWPLVQKALKKAIADVVFMRKNEGKRMASDIESHIEAIVRAVEKISHRRTIADTTREANLRNKIKKYFSDQSLDMNRVYTEAAILVEKSDVSEELVRLESHISQFRKFLVMKTAVGRSLDFLIQEMNREVNTIGSKSGDDVIGRAVVQAKSDLEKIREQVQNVE